MNTPSRRRPHRPQSALDDMHPTERLVRRVTSLERWVRTLTAQHEEWGGELGRLAAQLELTADRLAQFTDEQWGLDAAQDDDVIPF